MGYDPEVEEWKRMADSTTLHFYNVTEYGDTVEEYITQMYKEGKVKVAAMVETHLVKAKEAAVRDKMQKIGWRSVFAAARPTGRSSSGSHGGAMMISRKNLHCTPFRNKGDEEEAAKGLDWVAVKVRMKGIDVVYVALYMTCGIGPTGVNIKKMKEVMEFILWVNLPFVIMGDWNMAPEMLQQTGWVKKMQGEIMLPKGVQSTCSTGSLLDYAVASNTLNGSVGLDPVLKVPWKSHIGLSLTVSRAPRTALARYIKAPRSLEGMKDKEERTKKEGPGRGTSKSNEGIKGKPPSKFEDTALEPVIKDAKEIGKVYAKWSRKMEDWLIGVKGIEEEDKEKYRGRGQYPTFQISPAIDKVCTWEVTEGGREAQTWQTIGARMKSWKAQKGKGEQTEVEKVLREMAKEVDKEADRMKDVENFNDKFATKIFAERLRRIRSMHDNIITVMIEDAEVRAKKAQGKRKRQISARVNAWVADVCAGNMKKAHQFIKAEEGFRNDVFESQGGEEMQDLVDVMGTKETRWGDQWTQESQERIEALKKAMKDVVQKAKDEKYKMERPVLKEVRKLLHCLKDDRKLGLDHWSPKEWRELPDDAIEGLIDILMLIEEKVALPVQILINLMALLPKPQGGDRAVTLASLLYVLWTTVRGEEFREWDEGRQKHWDGAIKGSSALKAAIRRRMFDEVEVVLGGFVAGTYWDMDKFYDSIDPAKLIAILEEHGANLKLVAIAMQCHQAPRVLRSQACCSGVIQVTKSILAGCRKSNGFARSQVYSILEKATWQAYRQTLIEQFVDDVAQNTRGQSRTEVLEEAIEVTLMLAEEFKEEGLKVSKKTTVVCSNKDMRTKIQKVLKQNGLQVKAETEVKDLGVDAAGGARRSAKTQKKRLEKMKRRGKKVSWLRKKNKKATKLYKSNLYPAGTFGIANLGAAPSIIKQIRTTCADAALGAKGQCATIAIDLGIGQSADPEIAIRVTTIAAFVEQWAQSSQEERKKIRRAWRKILVRKYDTYRWRQVTGPVSAAMMTLRDMGWKTPAPDVWFDPQGQRWQCEEGKEINVQEIVDAITEHIKSRIWSKAAKHRNGKGMEGGIDATVVRKHLADLDKKGLEGKEMILRKAAAGAHWPRQRKFEAGLIESPMCQRCGIEEEDEMHRIWKCPANEKLTEKAITGSNRLKEEAVADDGQHACFWTRGLVPKKWTKAKVEEEAWVMRFGKQDWQGGTFYLDGSGGKNTKDKRLRKCGWAAVQQDSSSNITKSVQGICGTLTGSNQTVPRAELTALIKLLEMHKGCGQDLDVATDCLYVYKGANNLQGAKRMKKNADLWMRYLELQKEAEERGTRISVRKVKAHVDVVDIYLGNATLDDAKGNFLADAYAGLAAREGQVTKEEEETVRRCDQKAWQVQNRIIAITLAIMQGEGLSEEECEKIDKEQAAAKKERQKTEKEKKQRTRQLLSRGWAKAEVEIMKRQTDHDLSEEKVYGKKGVRIRWRCQQCLGVVANNRLKEWLQKGPCKAGHHKAGQQQQQETQCQDEFELDQTQMKRSEEEGNTEEERQEDEYEDVFGYAHLGLDEPAGNPPQDTQDEGKGQKPEEASVGSSTEVESNTEGQGLETARQRLQRLKASKKAKEEAAEARREEEKRRAERQKDEERQKAEEEERKRIKQQRGQGVHIDELDLGGAELHPSHRMHYKRGVVWCWECGAMVTQKARGLGRPCDLKATRGKQGWLNRLDAGDTPRKGMEWPLQEGIGPPEGKVSVDKSARQRLAQPGSCSSVQVQQAGCVPGSFLQAQQAGGKVP